MKKIPERLMTGIVAFPSGFMLAGIDPEDMNHLYTFSYVRNRCDHTQFYRVLSSQCVNMDAGRRVFVPTIHKVENEAIVLGNGTKTTQNFARAITQLLAQNPNQVSDNNPVLRHYLENLSCPQACVGGRSHPPTDLIIETAEILRKMPSVMHIGEACASGGAALDYSDGRFFQLEKNSPTTRTSTRRRMHSVRLVATTPRSTRTFSSSS